MTWPSTRLCLLVPILMFGLATVARAEERWLHLDPLKWETFVRFDGRWEDDEDNEETRDLDLESGIRLRQTGYSLDPRIANFSLELEPIYNRSDFDSSVAEDENTDGFTLNYSGRLNLLQGTPGPIGASAFASRSETTLDGSLGSETDIDNRDWGVGLNWKTNIFPTTLSYEESFTDQKFRASASRTTTERDNARRTLRLRGRSSKLSLALEREWFDDRTPTDSDSDTNKVRLGHRFDWGRNSRLTSRLDYFDRNQFNAFERLLIDENLRIQHAPNLSSSTNYQFTYAEQDTDGTEHVGRFQLTHDLYDNLTTTGHALGSYRDTEIIDETIYEGGLDFAYRKKIFRGVAFTAGLGGNYRVNDRDINEGVLRVVDEDQSVVATTTSFLLKQRFVIESSIIITDQAGVPYTETTDYVVVSVASDQTEIQIVSELSGGQINADAIANDPIPITVLVSYDYDPPPEGKFSETFSTTDFNYNLGLDFGWLAIYRDYSRQDERHMSGEEVSPLIDREDSRTGVELRWLRPPASATLVAERRFLKTGDFESTTYSFRELAVYSFAPGLTMNLSASQNFSDADNQDTDLYTGDLSLEWRPPRSRLFVRPNVSAWMRKDTGSTVTDGEREERFLRAGLDLRWSWRKLSVDLLYHHQIRRGDVNEKDEDRVMMTVTRGF